MHSDRLLFETLFEPFLVSPTEFNSLMARGQRYRAGPGGVVVEGGQPYGRVALLMNGEAHAYRHSSEAAVDPAKKATAVCKYVGKLDVPMEDDEEEEGRVPIRGAVIGGSAVLAETKVDGPFPHSVVATKPTEWVEWDAEVLREQLGPGNATLQASFLHLLYVELSGSHYKEKAAKIRHMEREKVRPVKPPTIWQLLSLTAFIGVPFFGFGFADNAIMILCGDTIDATFGASLGLTTLAAAGLGNWVSDCAGLGLGDAIERGASRLGLNDGGITGAQQKLRVTRMVTLSAKIIGISLGCFAGMVPLLFLKPRKHEFANEDLEVYDEIFLPNGITTAQFGSLMDKGTRRRAEAGSLVAHSGQKRVIMLVLRGEAHGYKGGLPVCRYFGRLDDAPSKPPPAQKRGETSALMQSRGSIIGGRALRDHSLLNQGYPYDVYAAENMEWIEWDAQELVSLIEEEKALQATFFSMLYGELLQSINKDRFRQRVERYKESLRAVIADGVVSDEERELLENYRKEYGISDGEHAELLKELGWTTIGWERGFEGLRERRRSSSDQPAAVLHLEEALPLIEQALLDLKLRLASQHADHPPSATAA